MCTVKVYLTWALDVGLILTVEGMRCVVTAVVQQSTSRIIPGKLSDQIGTQCVFICYSVNKSKLIAVISYPLSLWRKLRSPVVNLGETDRTRQCRETRFRYHHHLP